MSGLSRRAWYILTAALVLASGALYLGGAAGCGEWGFPLDDGWIHQTYARNLAATGQFAYVPGRVSTGSTSPLWTLLLALGYVLGVPFALWAYALGGVGWLLVGWASANLTRRLYPESRSVAPWVGAACVVEWHLGWAAFSGMETTLFTALSLLLIERYARGVRPFWLGLIGGLLFLARPEGIVLAGMMGVVLLFDLLPRNGALGRGGAVRALFSALAGVAVLAVPYIVFNTMVTGMPFPNTFYAKQAEYAALLEQPLWARLWIVLRRPLVGAQVLLIPGFLREAIRVLRGAWRSLQGERSESDGRPSPALVLLPLAWWGAYTLLYALRMPVDYQYGRYMVPTLPFTLIYGVVGTSRWLRPRSPQRVARVLGWAVPLAVACLYVAFLVLGGRAYASDVCVINGEMVDVARWLNAHTAEDAVVAAHDIGAIGYFAGRPLLDLAGLVTPEVIPFIRDQGQLLDFVIARGASYLATFPSWYPDMVADERLELVYQTNCSATRQRGGDNMAVYRVRR